MKRLHKLIIRTLIWITGKLWIYDSLKKKEREKVRYDYSASGFFYLVSLCFLGYGLYHLGEQFLGSIIAFLIAVIVGFAIIKGEIRLLNDLKKTPKGEKRRFYVGIVTRVMMSALVVS